MKKIRIDFWRETLKHSVLFNNSEFSIPRVYTRHSGRDARRIDILQMAKFGSTVVLDMEFRLTLESHASRVSSPRAPQNCILKSF